MNMKKIFAAVTASVLTIGAMSVVASADMLMQETAKSGAYSGKYDIDFSGLTEDQIKSIDKIEAYFGADTNYYKGIIGYNSLKAATDAGDIKKGWDGGDEIEIGDGEGEMGAVGKFVREIPAGDLAAVDEDGNIAPFAQVQLWWVNGVEYDGTTITKDGTVALKAVKLYAGDTVVATFGDENAEGPEKDAPAGGEESPAESTPEESTSTSTDSEAKDPVPTGVGGVAAVFGVVAVAAGALVVAKKRK